MTRYEERIANFSRRATRSAWLAIERLHKHPSFLELLSEFEKIEGRLLETDVEQALRRFVLRQPVQR